MLLRLIFRLLGIDWDGFARTLDGPAPTPWHHDAAHDTGGMGWPDD